MPCVIFDVDGTLIGGESQDWKCFDQAIMAILGFMPGTEFYRTLKEVTAQAIAEHAVQTAKRILGTGLEEQIQDEFLRRLREVHSVNPSAFPPRNGAAELLAYLNTIPGWDIAIATGDWHPTISFKLSAAGLDISGYPIATSSDSNRRSEIIRLAAQRAGTPLSEVVYVGDGVWDLKACRELGVRFIGAGSRTEHLVNAGANCIIKSFEKDVFLKALGAI
jgi:phosphoglycolate phosphatase-like HAD superfamily hydrolase